MIFFSWRRGTSLVVQWLKCCVPNAEGLHSGPWVRFLVGEVRSYLLQLKQMKKHPACCNYNLVQPDK